MFRLPPIPLTRPAVLVLLAVVLVTGACDNGPPDDATVDVTVMTRNVYLGADIFRLTEAQSAEEIPVIAAQVFATMQANDFEARAGALAAEIEVNDPDLIGLQEVETYRIQDPSDYVTGNTSVNATEVYIDFLAVLQDSLDARGLDYVVAGEVENADVELPAARSQTEFFDVRMTDRDVILARSDIATSNAGGAGFQIIVPFELASGDTIWFERGHTWVDVTMDGVEFVFVNAHLEVSAEGLLSDVQVLQASELITRFQAASPVIAVGDFNSGPGDDLSAYNVLTGAYKDAWAELGSGGTGLTCCHPELLNETRDFYSRIDLILYKGNVSVLSAEVLGDEAADRTAGGLWPSDHAGVVATLQVGN